MPISAGPGASGASLFVTSTNLTTTLADYVVTAGDSNGSDDTTALNALLSANAGKTVRLKPGQSFKISAPLVVYSGTTLVATGATITLLAGSNCQLLVNYQQTQGGSSRDTDITVVGGTWVRGSNTGTGSPSTTYHSLVFRRVDRLRVRDLRVTSSAGKYGISLGNVTAFRVERIDVDTYSDGVHIQGPASSGVVADVMGTTGDDMVAITTRDYATYNDTNGDVTGVTITGLRPVGSLTAVKLVGYAGQTLDQIKVSDVAGSVTSVGVQITDDTANGLVTSAGRVDVSDVHLTTGSGAAVVVCRPTAITHLNCRNLSGNTTGGLLQLGDLTGVTHTLGSVSLTGTSKTANGGRWVEVKGTAGTTTVRHLTVSRCRFSQTTGGGVYVYGSGASVADLHISDSVVDGVDYTAVDAVKADTSGTITRLMARNFTVLASRRGFSTDVASSSWWGGCRLQTLGTSSGNALRFGAGAHTVYVDGSEFGSNVLYTTGGATCRSKALGLGVDVSLLAKNNGDLAYNTNAGLGCGVGPVACNGTAWKHLYTGDTYTP